MESVMTMPRDNWSLARDLPSRAAASTALEFGRFRVLLRQRQLVADGAPIELGTRAFDILLVLLETAGSLVTKDELLRRVWPGVVVVEGSVKVQICALRKALGEDHDVIRTEFGRGYRFTAAVRSTVACGWAPRRTSRRWSRRGPAPTAAGSTARCCAPTVGWSEPARRDHDRTADEPSENSHEQDHPHHRRLERLRPPHRRGAWQRPTHGLHLPRPGRDHSPCSTGSAPRCCTGWVCRICSSPPSSSEPASHAPAGGP